MGKENIFYRLGHWWESRRKVRKSEFDALAARVKQLEDNAGVSRTVTVLQQQVDRLELFVGMKRQQPQTKSGAKIA